MVRRVGPRVPNLKRQRIAWAWGPANVYSRSAVAPAGRRFFSRHCPAARSSSLIYHCRACASLGRARSATALVIAAACWLPMVQRCRSQIVPLTASTTPMSCAALSANARYWSSAGAWRARKLLCNSPLSRWHARRRPTTNDGCWNRAGPRLACFVRRRVQSRDSRSVYERRMHKVLDHIDRQLDKPLDLESLAEVAHFSPFHFHRLFAAWMGETLGDYLRRRRVEVAAMRLSSQPRLSVLTAAISVGFGSGEAFTRAFKTRFGCSPTTWR